MIFWTSHAKLIASISRLDFQLIALLFNDALDVSQLQNAGIIAVNFCFRNYMSAAGKAR
jgi:hypothetical protein